MAKTAGPPKERKEKNVILTLRLKPDLHDWLRKVAEAENRSLGGQVEFFLLKLREKPKLLSEIYTEASLQTSTLYKLSESVMRRIWDNPEDRVYDRL